MRKEESQLYSVTIKQRVDGQIEVSNVWVPKEVLDEEPFIKEQIKNSVERELEENNIRVLKDVGVVQYD